MVILTFIICAILLAKMEQHTICSMLFKLIGILLNQGSKSFRSFDGLNKGTWIKLLSCLLCITVLTKCFTSLLLGTFFKTKPSLTVETLEDIVSNPEINVIGRASLKELKVFNPGIYEIINKRNIDYEKQLNFTEVDESVIFQSSKMLKDVELSKTVVLINSLNAKSLKIYFHLNNLMESEHKYIQDFIYTYVSKTLSNYKQIHRM